MSIKKSRSGDGYEVRWRESGRHRQETVRTRKQAEELERISRDRVVSRRLGLSVDTAPIVYDDLCSRYLAQHQVELRSLRTLEERLVYSRRTFGHVPVRELLPEHIAAWNAKLPVGRTRRGHLLKAMRQVLDAGVRWSYLLRNPASPDLVPTPPASVSEVRPLESWAQVDAVAIATGGYAPLIRFACATGLRPQEWQVLEWRDLDLASRACRVSRTLKEGARVASIAKTEASLRTVVLQRRAIEALDDLPRPLDRRRRLFDAPTGGVIDLSNFRSRVWHPALDAVGLEHRPLYQTRHTFATLALAAGAPLEWIARQLGHRDTRVTIRHYTRFLPAVDDRALAALDAFERAHDAHSLSGTRSE
jgi:integrase